VQATIARRSMLLFRKEKNGLAVVKESTIETTVAIHYRSIHDFKIRTCKITLANSGQASSAASRDDLTNAKKFVQLIALNRVFFKRDPFSVQKPDYEVHRDGGASFAMSLFGGKKDSVSVASMFLEVEEKNPRIYKVCCFKVPYADYIFPDEEHLFPYWLVGLTFGLLAPLNICLSRSMSASGMQTPLCIGNVAFNGGLLMCFLPMFDLGHWL